MVKKRVNLIIRPIIQTSVSVEKKTYTLLDDYADEKGLSKVKVVNDIFWKEIQKKLGTKNLDEIFKDDKEYDSIIRKLKHMLKSKLGADEEILSTIMEEGIVREVKDD